MAMTTANDESALVRCGSTTNEDLRSVLRDRAKCAFCRELVINPQVGNCGHVYCHLCVVSAVGLRPTCPTCRQPIRLPRSDVMLQDILVFLFAEDYAREVRTHSLDDRERMVIVDILPEQKEDQVIDPPIPPPKLRLYPFALALTLGVLILFSSFGLVSFILMMISMRNADGQSPVNSSSGLPPMVHTD